VHFYEKCITIHDYPEQLEICIDKAVFALQMKVSGKFNRQQKIKKDRMWLINKIFG
jgi:hypothetical protein